MRKVRVRASGSWVKYGPLQVALLIEERVAAKLGYLVPWLVG